MKILGIALIILGGVIYVAVGGADESPSALLAVPLIVGGILVHYRGRQHSARAKAVGPDTLPIDSQPKVLYLRSFQTDPSTTYQRLAAGWTTEEEDLKSVLQPFGDMVAIGQPGERLPVPGATRMYASQVGSGNAMSRSEITQLWRWHGPHDDGAQSTNSTVV